MIFLAPSGLRMGSFLFSPRPFPRDVEPQLLCGGVNKVTQQILNPLDNEKVLEFFLLQARQLYFLIIPGLPSNPGAPPTFIARGNLEAPA